MRAVFSALLAVVCVCVLIGPVALAAQSGKQQRGMMQVELMKTLDSKKLKPGDKVQAKLVGPVTLPNGQIIPLDTEVVGHVTQATARSKGAEENSIIGVLQAVGPDPDLVTTNLTSVEYDNNLASTLVRNGGANILPAQSLPMLNDQSAGVVGLKNLKLNSKRVLTSSNKELRLDSGTRLMLIVTMQ